MGSMAGHFVFCTARINWFGQYGELFCFSYCLCWLVWAVWQTILLFVLPVVTTSGNMADHFAFCTAHDGYFKQYKKQFNVLVVQWLGNVQRRRDAAPLVRNLNDITMMLFLQNVHCVGAGAEQVGALADGHLILYKSRKLLLRQCIDLAAHVIRWAVWRYDLYASQLSVRI